eukprot:CAMPEP_0113724218 /NCGR_PEP_ID=MMETSP0038_2-20120614/38927_1 /TAXON_ID=2898 /ORGANISM="Cryptomonas paramecium" /LENGTH=145 /DNA_ID=CAMNT_0000654035 /DNA_START=59 /DNA_END=492 /DNA_ORIENTATION=+ /assembly_acc=CAM_ASM_000170
MTKVFLAVLLCTCLSLECHAYFSPSKPFGVWIQRAFAPTSAHPQASELVFQHASRTKGQPKASIWCWAGITFSPSIHPWCSASSKAPKMCNVPGPPDELSPSSLHLRRRRQTESRLTTKYAKHVVQHWFHKATEAMQIMEISNSS